MVSRPRKSIKVDVKHVVLHEAGYRCANPVCRYPLTLELHHITQFSEGGADSADNLLALCPNCHTAHHHGIIPISSLRTWKYVLLSLNEAFDRKSVDLILMLDKTGGIVITSDSIHHWAGLLVSDLVRIGSRVYGGATLAGVDSFGISLSTKGRNFIDGWKRGNQQQAMNVPDAVE